jgi:dipeptidyl aminopeptidase/acylaminoacyl peptidase
MSLRFRLRNLALAALMVCSLPLLAQSKPGAFTYEQMMQLKRIGDFTVSPDNKWVVYSATDVSLAGNTRLTHLWIVPLAGGADRRLTGAGKETEDRPRFSPDGRRLLYTATRNGVSQIHVQNFDTASGELEGIPTAVTTLSTEADGALWSPDGAQILFLSRVYPDCADDACNKARDAEKESSKVKAQIFTRLFYRHWTQFNDGKRSHLFLTSSTPCAGEATACAPRDLTPGDFDVPPFSLGGQDQYAFSPDGKEIAYSSNHDAVEAISTNNDVFLLSLTDPNAKAVNLTAENHGSDGTPVYSPNGKYLAIVSQFRAAYESDRFRLRLIDRATRKIANLTENFDRWVGSVSWAPDSQSLFITAEDKGEAPIYQVALDGKAPVEIIRGTDDSPTLLADGKTLVFGRNSVRFPEAIFRATLPLASSKAGEAAPVTHLNDAILAAVQMQPVEPFWFTGAEKHPVEGFLLKPPDFDPAKKYPVKFLIHGGPQGAWGDDWSYRWNPNLFAASGYVTVMINPRGSTGYGQQFIDDINGDWGGRAFEDLMLGLDYAEKTYAFLDKTRECALGASYGGYMANWLEGHTNRFQCIVSHDGMFNPESAYGTTEELWFNEWEFKGTPWENRELYRKWSPALAAKNFKTPMLVIHGQLDYRLDAGEGFQLFTTLQRLKVPSKLLYFPDEGHWVTKPQNGQLWYKTVTEWCDQWTKK